MQVALVNPPIRVDPRNIASGIATPPLWAAYLCAVLQRAGHTVTVIDAAGLGLDQQWGLDGGFYRGLTAAQIASRLPQDVDVIGLSCMFSSTWPVARFLLRALHEARPDALLLAGGEHPTALPHTVLDETPARVVVTGEGEATATALADHLQAQHWQPGHPLDLHGVAGLLWQDGAGTTHDETRRPRWRAVDDIPPPDWSQIPVAAYMALGSGVGANRGPFMPLLATRGCPHQCTFCASPGMWTTSYFTRDPKAVVDEMARNHREHGATDIQFADLTAIVSRKWTLDFCRELSARKLPVTWQLPSGTRSEVIDDEVAQAMANAGCTNLAFALESGDPAVLKRSKKRSKLPHQLRAARALMRRGVRVGGFFVVGFPYDTPRSLWRTLVLIARCAALGFSEVNVSAFVPVPGSEDFRTLLAEGKLTVNDAYYHNLFHWLSLGKQVSYCPWLRDGQLRLVVLACYLTFFTVSWTLRPWRLLTEVGALLRGRGDRGKIAKVLRGYRRLSGLKTVPAQ